MKTLFRTFVVLPALVLALVALPSVVMAAGGPSLTATMAAVFGAPQYDLQQTIPPSPLPTPTPHGTVPPPTPRPRPQPQPQPVSPTPAPSKAATGAMLGSYKITKVIGDRLSSTLYVYTDNNWLYRSDLDGRSWYLVVTDPFVGDFLMSASDPNVLYSGEGPNCTSAALTISPMYKSVDGGETWDELPTGLDLKPLLIDQSNPDNVFASDCTTLYLSTDGGQTWSPKPAAAADNLWQTYAPVDMSSGSLVGNPRPAAPHWDQLFAVGNDLQNVGVVAFSGDMGDTWANITDPSQAPVGVTTVLASLYEGGQLWIVDSKGVWSTADYGVNWTFSNNGLQYLGKTNVAMNDLAYGSNGSLYLATGAGLYIQSKVGGVWEKPDDATFNTQNMLSLLITETNPRRLWINAEDKDGDPIVYTYIVR